jgi:hypothetical protein
MKLFHQYGPAIVCWLGNCVSIIIIIIIIIIIWTNHYYWHPCFNWSVSLHLRVVYICCSSLCKPARLFPLNACTSHPGLSWDLSPTLIPYAFPRMFCLSFRSTGRSFARLRDIGLPRVDCNKWDCSPTLHDGGRLGPWNIDQICPFSILKKPLLSFIWFEVLTAVTMKSRDVTPCSLV